MKDKELTMIGSDLAQFLSVTSGVSAANAAQQSSFQ
jgi:hypothetical protein